MESTKYNGWTNYETWAANLWIDNEEATDYIERHGDDATYELSEYLKSEMEENTPTTCGVYADLLNAAISEINLYEIAEHLIDYAKEELEPEESESESAKA